MSDQALTLMALSREDIGDEYAAFAHSSSFERRADRLQYVDEDEAQDLQKFGMVKMYRERYSGEEPALTGPLSLGTSVFLFESDEGASGYLQDDLQDMQRKVGESNVEATIEAAELFTVDGIGDEATGLEVHVIFNPGSDAMPAYQTLVLFRRGAVLGLVSLLRADDQEARTEVTRLATKLDQRIQAVLAGQVKATPTQASD